MEQYSLMFNYSKIENFNEQLRILLIQDKIDNNILMLKFLIDNKINDEECISRLITNIIYQEENIIFINPELDTFLHSLSKINSLFHILNSSIGNFIDEDYYKYLIINNIQDEKINISEIMRMLLNQLTFLKNNNLLTKYKFYIENQLTSLSGYIFNNLSLFDGTYSKDFSEGIFYIIQFLYENFEDFNLSFENLYREQGSNLKKLCSEGFCIDIYFENYFLESDEDEIFTYLSEDL